MSKFTDSFEKVAISSSIYGSAATKAKKQAELARSAAGRVSGGAASALSEHASNLANKEKKFAGEFNRKKMMEGSNEMRQRSLGFKQ